MDETQKLEDSFLEEEDEVVEEMDTGKEREPLAKLRVFNNEHFPETELPLFLGDNVLGRDPASCSLPLSARSVSKRHAVISIARLRGGDGRHGDGATEALLWDLGSMNGTRKGRLRLTPTCATPSARGTSWSSPTCPVSSSAAGEGGAGREAGASATAETGRGRGGPRRIARGCVSDSDSEGEISVRKERRAKLFVPDSDSPRESSLSCSTFLTPTSRFVPDSEEESSITPSSPGRLDRSRTGKTPKHVSDSDPDDEEEEDEEEEAGTNSHVDCAAKTLNAEPSGARPPVEPGRNEAAFKIRDSESDTDAEGEESAGNAPGAAGDKAVLPEAGPSTGPAARPEDFHLDSDTDAEDEADAAPASVPASVPARDQNAKPPAAVQQTDFHLDSDTDEEDEADAATASVPASVPARDQNAKPPAAVQQTDFHLDSDTDAGGRGGGYRRFGSRGERPARPRLPPVNPRSRTTTATRTRRRRDPSRPRPRPGLAILSDSDPDAEEDSQTAAPGGPIPRCSARAPARLESDSDTDLEERTPPSRSPRPNPSPTPETSTWTATRTWRTRRRTEAEERRAGGEACELHAAGIRYRPCRARLL
ncbi:hypothetical protein ANANG_G00005960 [Anguilla anguilla]|uniref:FHA domain-containing protein n=1 Tax=Anguilla anguilla TaxID=7936 RepID=A0A9D3S978_ANGAN|nr:hypothetical protein ANANG_G00005960 [Anguilla anguilla]